MLSKHLLRAQKFNEVLAFISKDTFSKNRPYKLHHDKRVTACKAVAYYLKAREMTDVTAHCYIESILYIGRTRLPWLSLSIDTFAKEKAFRLYTDECVQYPKMKAMRVQTEVSNALDLYRSYTDVKRFITYISQENLEKPSLWLICHVLNIPIPSEFGNLTGPNKDYGRTYNLDKLVSHFKTKHGGLARGRS